MRNVHRDKNGVPILNISQVEEIAESFLARFDKECLTIPKATPVLEIANSLQSMGLVTFVYDKDLGISQTGKKYLGRFHIPSRTIYVDRALVPHDPRLKFTVAHEIAHFVLHSDIKPQAINPTSEEKDVDIEDSTEHIIMNRLVSGDTREWGPRSWIEWQANRFAASFIMPRVPVLDAVIKKQKEFNISQNLGKINENQIVGGELEAITGYIKNIFDVSKESALVRLIETGIIEDRCEMITQRRQTVDEPEHKLEPMHISVAIRELFNSLLKNNE